MRPMIIGAGTVTGAATAFYLGYRKNLEEVEMKKQLLLNLEQKLDRQLVEIGKLAVKVDELKEKVVYVGELVKLLVKDGD
ncbi:hypothetical protein ACET3Z_001629 [Daucus carota]